MAQKIRQFFAYDVRDRVSSCKLKTFQKGQCQTDFWTHVMFPLGSQFCRLSLSICLHPNQSIQFTETFFSPLTLFNAFVLKNSIKIQLCSFHYYSISDELLFFYDFQWLLCNCLAIDYECMALTLKSTLRFFLRLPSWLVIFYSFLL